MLLGDHWFKPQQCHSHPLPGAKVEKPTWGVCKLMHAAKRVFFSGFQGFYVMGTVKLHKQLPFSMFSFKCYSKGNSLLPDKH